jgi:hypothetical protein
MAAYAEDAPKAAYSVQDPCQTFRAPTIQAWQPDCSGLRHDLTAFLPHSRAALRLSGS